MLTDGLAGMPVASPSAKALRDLRRRLGAVPVRSLLKLTSRQWSTEELAAVLGMRLDTVVQARARAPLATAVLAAMAAP